MKASSTLVESRADVSMKKKPSFSETAGHRVRGRGGGGSGIGAEQYHGKQWNEAVCMKGVYQVEYQEHTLVTPMWFPRQRLHQ